MQFKAQLSTAGGAPLKKLAVVLTPLGTEASFSRIPGPFSVATSLSPTLTVSAVGAFALGIVPNAIDVSFTRL